MLNSSDLLLAISGGLITASWGAFKDTPYEGFSPVSFIRSVVITAFYYFFLQQLLINVNGTSNSLLIILASIGLERITQEIWKGFFRSRQRSNIYKIPQSFHIFGQVPAYIPRLLSGIMIVSLLVFFAYVLLTTRLAGNAWLVYGLLFAVVPSFGGAWKDAPIEGFDVRKFPRSFLVMFIAIALLHSYTDNLLVLIMSAGGLERLLVEFYKTFIVLSTPGKFFEKVHHKHWLKKRALFAWTYLFAIVGFISALWLLAN